MADAVPLARWRPAAEVALIFLVFFIHAGWPAPDVNEPHYLGKARHYWDATWSAPDFFLGTADAHEAFYFTFGWLTLWLPLPAVAWCGRVVTWVLLAWAWRRLSVALVDGLLFSVLSAALFVTLNSRLHMAGEWVVGGVEAKGLAYVLVLLGVEALVRAFWGRALVLFGAASAFHVVVGGWAVVATGIAWLVVKQRPPLRTLVLPAMVGGLLSLPGLWPALELTRGAAPEAVREANRLYVYERLPHHLLPESLPAWYVARHLLLIAALVPLAWIAPRSERLTRLLVFVGATVGIAAVGWAISLLARSQPDFAAALLRYYWFRMSDSMVPLGVALLVTVILHAWQQAHYRWFVVGLSAAMVAAGAHLGDTMWMRHRYRAPRADWQLAGVDLDDWRSVCRWASEDTPSDALFLVPRLSHTFRWYAGRGEVVTRKDLPQDAAGIVEWWRRLTAIYRPGDTRKPVDSLAELGAERLEQLGRQFGADYVVTQADPPLPLPRVGPLTRTVAVYRLSPAAPSEPAPATGADARRAPEVD